ncbi:hypothetical protein GGR57DRAFT_498500 [Xylariaceae sp. FL1272]|nr:hypothetical protein GGR57DRAFT_498500 [Xylariaceae sp. FL1272]
MRPKPLTPAGSEQRRSSRIRDQDAAAITHNASVSSDEAYTDHQDHTVRLKITKAENVTKLKNIISPKETHIVHHNFTTPDNIAKYKDIIQPRDETKRKDRILRKFKSVIDPESIITKFSDKLAKLKGVTEPKSYIELDSASESVIELDRDLEFERDIEFESDIEPESVISKHSLSPRGIHDVKSVKSKHTPARSKKTSHWTPHEMLRIHGTLKSRRISKSRKPGNIEQEPTRRANQGVLRDTSGPPISGPPIRAIAQGPEIDALLQPIAQAPVASTHQQFAQRPHAFRNAMATTAHPVHVANWRQEIPESTFFEDTFGMNLLTKKCERMFGGNERAE